MKASLTAMSGHFILDNSVTLKTTWEILAIHVEEHPRIINPRIELYFYM